MKKYLLSLTLFMCFVANAQQPIDVTESTLKVHGLGEEVFYYGFAEGDKLIFSFEEVNGKELKEIEIIELPSSSKFMDYKTAKIENKTLNISRTGIYKFRLANTAIAGRVCKFKIQRIPASDATKDFNTSVYWKDVYDTTYTTEQEQYVARIDTTFQEIINTTSQIHSKMNSAGNKSIFNFTIPKNTISWSYYIGADQSGVAAYETAVRNFAKTASPLVSSIPTYGPLAALALNGISTFPSLQRGQSVVYAITDATNAQLFNAGQPYRAYKTNRAINDFAQMHNDSGTLFFCLMNENDITAVDVVIKGVAVVVNKQIALRPVTKMHVASHSQAYLK